MRVISRGQRIEHHFNNCADRYMRELDEMESDHQINRAVYEEERVRASDEFGIGSVRQRSDQENAPG